MSEEFSRTESLIGKENLDKLADSTVAIFGLGGVGSYTAEALARCGIGSFVLVDNDTISPSNINRQLYALHSTLGMLKTEIAAKRMLDINPMLHVKQFPIFYSEESKRQIDLSKVDYIIDCIDTVSAKILLAKQAQKFHVKHISCMGTGNKLDPFKFKIADISETSVCPLARSMRHEVKKHGIEKMKVLYSTETPAIIEENFSPDGKPIPASISFVPSVAGLMIASEVVKDLLAK